MANLLYPLVALFCALAVAGGAQATDVKIPNFWGAAPSVPVQSAAPPQSLRLLVTDDAKPLSFLDSEGSLTGFDVDMARALCERMKVVGACEVSAQPRDKLVEALLSGEGDLVMGHIPVTAETRLQVDFSHTYFKIPARFVARKSGSDEPVRTGARVGVVEGSPHQAMFADFFPKDTPAPYRDARAMLADVADGKIDMAFGDGLVLASWLDTDRGAACCRFIGGPYLSTAYLGPGMAVAMRPGDQALGVAVDNALAAINADGTSAELYLRWFPVGLY